MAKTELAVLIGSEFAGVLRQDSNGLVSFEYDQDYAGVPLSSAMPPSNRVYGQDVVRPYLFGLLPDSERQRRAIARENGISANNPVALLSAIGLDCPGAVQFCLRGAVEETRARLGGYRKLSDDEIVSKLRAIRSDSDATWMGRNESWSLGGNQGKFALALLEGQWYECTGSAPTTHIFKNGVEGFKLEALNEYVCMRTAAGVGIPTANVEYRLFNEEPALIVTRYDRLTRDGVTERLHQEDLCQALGVMPEQKYTSDGAPTARDILELLCGLESSSVSLRLFTRMLFFNCLIGAPDAHAKNYSLLLTAHGSVLAPLYDVASGLAYEQVKDFGRLAMSIGGENRIGRVGEGAIRRYAGANDLELGQRLAEKGLTQDICLREMGQLAEAIPRAMGGVFAEACAAGLPGASELRDRLLPRVEKNCARTLALL